MEKIREEINAKTGYLFQGKSFCLVGTQQMLQPPGTTTSSDTSEDVFNNTGDAEQPPQFNPCFYRSASVSLA